MKAWAEILVLATPFVLLWAGVAFLVVTIGKGPRARG